VIQVIPSNKRYHFETDWLSTYWHFSFDHYHDPANVSFGPLRVFNNDIIRPAGGFPMHGHREMEIVTYVIEGELEHRDSMGNVGQIRPGEIQRMSAGTGVRHSEYNASEEKPLHLIQLWILPAVKGLEPSWEQHRFPLEARTGKLLAVAVPVDAAGKAENGAVHIHQDASIYTSLLKPGQSVAHALDRDRRAYLFVISGELAVNGEKLGAGDQARIIETEALKLAAGSKAADFLLIDLP